MKNLLDIGNNKWCGIQSLLCMAGMAMSLIACEQESTHVAGELDFNYHIKPILSDKCFACHGPDKNSREAGLRLDTPEGAKKHVLESGGHAFVEGSLGKSEAFQRMLSTDPNIQMPPPESHLSLTNEEIDILEAWIKSGADYTPHWAFIPPKRSDFPSVEQTNWIKNPIDYFVLAQLESKGLSPQPAADKETLIRRLSFDLTGLPPSIQEIDAFLQDSSENAYEKLVDRLLESPHYGERMAVDWMDLSRYADTHGYTVDFSRPTWPWRDWVIQAFNDNMPYDQFVSWQIAGDMIAEASKEQVLATGFNRNHAQNAEGGIVNEEFQVAYVADRTETFATAFLGLTMQCARCHDHKYDPISQKDYYSLYSFFNQVNESGQITWSRVDMPSPTMLLPDDEVKARMNFLRQEIQQREDSVQQYVSNPVIKKAFNTWLSEAKPVYEEPVGKLAHYSFEAPQITRVRSNTGRDHGQIIDPVTGKQSESQPTVIDGVKGNGLLLNGDDALDFPSIGRFTKSDAFSIGIWVQVPENLKEGVIFHSNKGGIIYNFKGYQVSVEGNRWDIRLAHTFPYNAIHMTSVDTIEREVWQHLMLTYDGSGRASGVRFYVNGRLTKLKTEQDKLYKDIVFVRENVDTHLKVGARWRSRGFREGKVDELVVYDRELTPWEVSYWDRVEARESQLAEMDTAALYEYFISQQPELKRFQRALHTYRSRYDSLVEPVMEVMVIDEREQPRPTYLLERGEYSAKGEEVLPNTPQDILSFSDSLPANRLGLVQWLFHPEHPLTARIVVNRLWQQCFGNGLVKTQEDFGNQGDLPTHPQLLDWLAIECLESGWDIKHLLKQIVMSSTYRQQSEAPVHILEMDPDNQGLTRGPKMRLTAEMLRDQALAASGLLVRDIGGPSVKPYQPKGLWKVNSGTYVQDHGDDLYRRSLYTFWKRTVPPPSMNTFDAPTRSYCLVRRQKTHTPLQALTLMNDPQFQEAARVMGQKILQSNMTTQERLIYIFRNLTSRYPSDDELSMLAEMYHKQLETFQKEPQKTKGWISVGEYPTDETLPPAEHASYAVVISTLMNFDGAVYKR